MIYDILNKNLVGSEPLLIRFNKIDEFISINGEARYLRLFGSEKYDAIYERIWYRISLKSGVIYIFSHYFVKIKVDSYDSLPIEKRSTLHSVIIFIKTVLNKEKNLYYYKIFLEKCCYQLANK